MPQPYRTMAIAYDFDGTLAPGNMQEHNFIPALEMRPAEFWQKTHELAMFHEADDILAYMQLMLEMARNKKIPVRRENFTQYGAGIQFFKGVETWFERIRSYAKDKKVELDHYIISSGLREMIAGTRIAKHFRQIYASGFMYDHNGVAYWPALAVNYTTKTQYLFRINKGCLDVCDNAKINEWVEHEERAVPFANMVFIGDGQTDVPCMRLVKDYGGHSIAVYDPAVRSHGATSPKEKALKLVRDNRATLAAKADYSEGSDIDVAVRAMIDKAASNAVILKIRSSSKTPPADRR